jgi:hypothetical protein
MNAQWGSRMNLSRPFRVRSFVTILLASFAPVLAGCGSSTPSKVVDAAPLDSAELAPADAATCPASCDDGQPCTQDSCDPATHACVHVPLADGTRCEDGNACTINDVCQGGLCFSGPFKTCSALDQCHVAGVCAPRTGECTNPNANNNIRCDDGLKCTSGDQCIDGVCTGSPLPCPDGFACDESVGSCQLVSNDGGLADGGASYAFPAATSGLVLENLNWASSGSALVRDPGGRVFGGGYFAGKANLGVGVMDTGDVADSDLFVAEFDASTGKALWSRSFGGPQNQTTISVAANGTGQIALLGALAGSMTVGATEVIAKTTADYYLLGASATDGAGQWVRRFSMRANAAHGRGSLNSVAGAPNGSAFVMCGTTDKAATDISSTLQAQGGVDIVLASFAGDTGLVNWAQQIGGVNDENCNFVATDAQSNIYVVGTYLYGSSVSIGGLPPLPMVDQTNGTTWIFVAKLDSAGHGLWAQSIGTSGVQSSFKATAVLPVSDGVMLAGLVPTTGTVGGITLSQSSPLFLTKLAGDSGQIVWTVPMGTAQAGASDAVTLLSSNSKGAVIVAGRYANSLSLGKYALPPTTNSGAFVAQLSGATGQLLAARGYGGATEVDLILGMITNTTGTDADKDSSLFLGQFVTQIDLGSPLGALKADPAATIPSTFVAKIVP